MRLAQIQFSPWDKIYNFSFNELNLKIGDKVIVKTELGLEIGDVLGFIEVEENKINCLNCENNECQEYEIKSVLRLATPTDLENRVTKEEKREAIKFCKETAQKLGLSMKIIDVRFSLDRSRLTFGFVADGRVDFRELVKELTRHFNCNIRLQQIGIRDEARAFGDFGHCGRELCCKKFLKDLISITSEMADIQQCSHRGSDRLSGVCGRLMCCLAYEEKGYTELAKNMPPIGKNVDVDGRKGVIVGHHYLKQSVDVEFPSEKSGERPIRIEIDLNRKKK